MGYWKVSFCGLVSGFFADATLPSIIYYSEQPKAVNVVLLVQQHLCIVSISKLNCVSFRATAR
jgi:hypothetical protein